MLAYLVGHSTDLSLTLLEKFPELEGLLKKYRKTMSYVGISSVLMSEHGMKVSKSSVPNLLKEIDFKKREERNRKRRIIYS